VSTNRILYPSWREYNEPTTYPFADGATLRNDAGLFIPEGAILDAVLYPVGGGRLLRLSKAVVAQDYVRLYVGDEISDELCYGEFAQGGDETEIRLQDAYGRPAGLLVSSVERLTVFQSWAPGTHAFTYAQTGFLPDVCIPSPEIGVRGFLLDDGSLVSGDAWLIGDDGVVLELETGATLSNGCQESTTPADYQTVVVHVVGDPLFRRRLCSGLFAAPRFLETITIQRDCRKIVCYPDDQGDFKMTVGHQDAEDTVLRIRHVNGGLRIEVVGEAQDRTLTA
jgi:hypothetical protein